MFCSAVCVLVSGGCHAPLETPVRSSHQHLLSRVKSWICGVGCSQGSPQWERTGDECERKPLEAQTVKIGKSSWVAKSGNGSSPETGHACTVFSYAGCELHEGTATMSAGRDRNPVCPLLTVSTCSELCLTPTKAPRGAAGLLIAGPAFSPLDLNISSLERLPQCPT